MNNDGYHWRAITGGKPLIAPEQQQAFLFGSVVSAGDLGASGLDEKMIVGPNAPRMRDMPIEVHSVFGKRYSVYWHVSQSISCALTASKSSADSHSDRLCVCGNRNNQYSQKA